MEQRGQNQDARADPPIPAEWEQWARTLIAFKGANPETRAQQIEALVRAEGEDAVVAALREVATRHPEPRIRRGAIQVLMVMGGPKAFAAIQSTLGDEDPAVRNQARISLRRQTHER